MSGDLLMKSSYCPLFGAEKGSSFSSLIKLLTNKLLNSPNYEIEIYLFLGTMNVNAVEN